MFVRGARGPRGFAARFCAPAAVRRLPRHGATPLVTHGVLASRRTSFEPVFPDRSAGLV
jgi:hypothetical protein